MNTENVTNGVRRTTNAPGIRQVGPPGVKLVSPDKVKRRVPKSENETKTEPLKPE